MSVLAVLDNVKSDISRLHLLELDGHLATS